MTGLHGILEPLVTDSDNLQLAIKKLHDWGCCPRCILRFLGEKQPFVYQKEDDELFLWVQDVVRSSEVSNGKTDRNSMGTTEGQTEDVTDEGIPGLNDKPPEEPGTGCSSDDRQEKPAPLDASGFSNVCVACLGLLQDHYCSDRFRKELQSIVKKQDPEYDNFCCSLLLPCSLLLREHAVYLALNAFLPAVYTPATESEVTPVKDAWKWHNGSDLAELLGARFSHRSCFDIVLNFTHPHMERECSFLADMFPGVFQKRRKNRFGWELFTRANVGKAIDDISSEHFRKVYSCPPRPSDLPCDCAPITCTHEPIFIAGRYNKYSRELSQTPWVLSDGERKSESSVEEYIVAVLRDALKADEYRFSSSGREDVDVKMLGTGRPFVIEAVNPRRIHHTPASMSALQEAINRSTNHVAVRDLQVVSREEVGRLKEGEMEKVKKYAALCWSREEISQEMLDIGLKEIKDLVVKQKTPIRVLHRRPLAVRDKIVHSLSGKLEDKHHFVIHLATQAGTYVKEFVHGDFGRTAPNLGTILGIECDILELDVEGVELDWPKKLDE